MYIVTKITQNNSSYACDIVLVSDAGNNVPFDKFYKNTFTLLLRTVETFMVRIKNFQMMQNMYSPGNRREIAYQSLGWDLENCLTGFYDNLKSGNISSELSKAHKLNHEWVEEPYKFKSEILSYISSNCQYEKMSAKFLPDDRLKAIRKIGTNLTTIKKTLIKDMIVHAENLTELQLRLYCPSLFIKEAELNGQGT
ncbi:hypothetical protein [Mucilaginibacter pedocola]|uniref:Uncharacterized protein n=1 Tax=Mucilaginibacter pedocola TaxID=1792845 RepID=A0A1S9PHA3_9SPHI|nr:hypothetical protein [Mucilaginibacter pedocola]OOQ60331.1 hypothetical protein BC343_25230 [Mucilaginibacter pedocola]